MKMNLQTMSRWDHIQTVRRAVVRVASWPTWKQVIRLTERTGQSR